MWVVTKWGPFSKIKSLFLKINSRFVFFQVPTNCDVILDGGTARHLVARNGKGFRSSRFVQQDNYIGPNLWGELKFE